MHTSSDFSPVLYNFDNIHRTLIFSIVLFSVLANIQIYTWHTIQASVNSEPWCLGLDLFITMDRQHVYWYGEKGEKVRLCDEIKIYVTYLNRNSAYIFIRQAADTRTHTLTRTCIVNTRMLPRKQESIKKSERVCVVNVYQCFRNRTGFR